MNALHVGFTGTQTGLNRKQQGKLRSFLEELNRMYKHAAPFLHHGDCIGADALAHRIARESGFFVIIHPPINVYNRAFCGIAFASEKILPTKEYLERNHDIVDATEFLIACPKGLTEEVRSGTWATVRYARKCGKKVYIFYPDGTKGY
jgi:hypothetical protein